MIRPSVALVAFALFLNSPIVLRGQDLPSPDREAVVPVPSIRAWLPDLTAGRIERSASETRPGISGPTFSGRGGMVFTVTTLNDTGAGSLRRAIQDANATPGSDIIQFAIPGAGVKVIALKSTLDIIGEPVVIDGATQPGYSGTPLIRIDGALAGASNGLDMIGGGSTVRAIAVTRFSNDGIVLGLQGRNLIEGCYVGIAPDGITAAGNGRFGIRVVSDSNSIGNPAGQPNVISGNGNDGIEVTVAARNVIRNSRIGTNASGSGAVPNAGFGIYFESSSDDTVGGPEPGAGNVISGNGKAGVSIRGTLSSRIVVQGNRIGTDAAGLAKIPNLHGVEITQVDVPGGGGAVYQGTPSFITIGGPGPAFGNLISGNLQGGIAIFQDTLLGNGIRIVGNRIGMNAADSDTIPNILAGIFIRKYPVGGVNSGVIIGGASTDSGNVVSGNRQHGIWIRGSGARNNVVRGNHVGVVPGSQALTFGNQLAGIVLDTASSNVIGGGSFAAGNFIGRNRGGGLSILGAGAGYNVVTGNAIGAKYSDAATWAGNAGYGIYIESTGNTIGAKDRENTVAGGSHAGIFVAAGTANSLRFNRTYANGGLGIDLAPAGITPGDSLDADAGANLLANAPILDSGRVVTGGVRVAGRLHSTPGTQYTLDFFLVEIRNASKFGEGRTWLDSLVVTTDVSGRASFSPDLPGAVSADNFITAISTDPYGNTSEFSRALCLKDADADGIVDCWETAGDGIDVNADGTIDLDLNAKGAKPDHKDLFVEVDHMAGFHPSPVALQRVANAFAAVPNKFLGNPDGAAGIHLVVEHEPADSIPGPSAWNYPPWTEFFGWKALRFGTGADRSSPNSANILAAKRLVYRYCIWANRFNDRRWSGVAEAVGAANDFVVTLGSFTQPGGTEDQQAGTFMHELGHTLGLGHGGGDHVNWKPNFYSVMNYLWQFPKPDLPGQPLSWNLDFARSAMGSLDENTLPEINGITADFNDYPPIILPFTTAGGSVRTGWIRRNAAIDWDGNGDSSGYAASAVDLNAFYGGTSPGQVLQGHADWQSLKYSFRHSPYFVDGVTGGRMQLSSVADTVEDEMTPEIYQYLQTLPPYGALEGSGVPEFNRADTTVIGGFRTGLEVRLLGPAPTGGITFHAATSDSTLLEFPYGNEIFFFAGQTLSAVDVVTPTVDRETTVVVSIADAPFETICLVRITPARLLSADRASSDRNVVAGFERHSYPGAGGSCSEWSIDSAGTDYSVADRPLTVFGLVDGEIGPSGATWSIWSSVPAVFPETTVVIPAGTSDYLSMEYRPSPGAAYPDSVRIYCSIYGDTVSFLAEFLRPPRFVLQDLSVGPATCDQVLAINDAAQILGTWGGRWALWQAGSLTYLDSLAGYTIDLPTHLNDAGDIAGIVFEPGKQLAARWMDGSTQVLPDTDALRPMTIVTGFNDNGTVIGYRDDFQKYWYRPVGFVWPASSPATDLPDPPEALYTVPLGINDAGKVVGWTTHRFRDIYNTPIDYGSSFSWTGGDPVSEDFLCLWYDSSCCSAADGPKYTKINNRGTIIGVRQHSNAINEYGGRFGYADWPAGALWAGSYQSYARGDGWLSIIGNWFDLNDNDDVAGAGYEDALASIGMKVYNLNAVTDVPAGWNLKEARGILEDNRIIVNAVGPADEKRGYLLVPDTTMTGVGNDRGGGVPRDYTLDQNFPNPFNPVTTIRYGIPSAGQVTMRVYDLLGQEVARLVDTRQAAGYHAVDWNASALSSGVYYYRLEAGGTVLMRACMVVK